MVDVCPRSLTVAVEMDLGKEWLTVESEKVKGMDLAMVKVFLLAVELEMLKMELGMECS